MKKTLLVTFLLAFLAGPSGAQQSDSAFDTKVMADSVRQEFLHAWNAYKTYAWGHDQLRPLSKTPYDWYGVPLSMTQVESMDAMILMGLTAEADSAREYVATHLSFDHDIYVQHFELVIRLLGGLLSCYELTGDARLLRLAEDLGNRLLPAFNSPTGMPYVSVNLRTGDVRGAVADPAGAGTLLVEFGTLSELTGKRVYYDRAKRALVEIYKRRSRLGLVGQRINVETGAWTDSVSHVGGRIDSYYEYLLKCSILFGDKDCLEMWRSSIDSVNKYLAHEAPTGFWYARVDMNTGRRVATRFGALDAFFPAVLALSGDTRRAVRLEESCFRMWTKFAVEPEELDYTTMRVTKPTYPLRPEIIESAYYLYHYTKDKRYLGMGRTFLRSLVRYCRTDAGYAGLKSVETMEKADLMESFFLAETLKYLYLLFAPPGTLDFDTVIFNTEAHPLKRGRVPHHREPG